MIILPGEWTFCWGYRIYAPDRNLQVLAVHEVLSTDYLVSYPWQEKFQEIKKTNCQVELLKTLIQTRQKKWCPFNYLCKTHFLWQTASPFNVIWIYDFILVGERTMFLSRITASRSVSMNSKTRCKFPLRGTQ